MSEPSAELADVLAEHAGIDWVDGEYYCLGCLEGFGRAVGAERRWAEHVAEQVERVLAGRFARLLRLHRSVPVCVGWEDCLHGEDGGHEHDEVDEGDICRTCPPVLHVCDHCYDEYGEALEWPCATALALALPPATPTPDAAE